MYERASCMAHLEDELLVLLLGELRLVVAMMDDEVLRSRGGRAAARRAEGHDLSSTSGISGVFKNDKSGRARKGCRAWARLPHTGWYTT